MKALEFLPTRQLGFPYLSLARASIPDHTSGGFSLQYSSWDSGRNHCGRNVAKQTPTGPRIGADPNDYFSGGFHNMHFYKFINIGKGRKRKARSPIIQATCVQQHVSPSPPNASCNSSCNLF
jgi:hypothetical protein